MSQVRRYLRRSEEPGRRGQGEHPPRVVTTCVSEPSLALRGCPVFLSRGCLCYCHATASAASPSFQQLGQSLLTLNLNLRAWWQLRLSSALCFSTCGDCSYCLIQTLQPRPSFDQERASSGTLTWIPVVLCPAPGASQSLTVTWYSKDDLSWDGDRAGSLVLTINVSFHIFQFLLRTGKVVQNRSWSG